MGCGASTSRTGDVVTIVAQAEAGTVVVKDDGSTLSKVPSKNKQGRSLDKKASLGSRKVVNSFTVSLTRKGRASETGEIAAATEAEAAANETSTSHPQPAGTQLQQTATLPNSKPHNKVSKFSTAAFSCMGEAPSHQPDTASSSLPPDAKVYQANLIGSADTQQLQAAVYFRKLTCGPHPPIKHMSESGVVKDITALLETSTSPETQIEAAWTIANVCAHSHQDCSHASEQGAAAVLVHILSTTQDSRVVEQVLWALGNIAGDVDVTSTSQPFAQEVLELGGLMLLLDQLKVAHDKPTLLRVASWCLMNLLKHKRDREMVDTLPALTHIILTETDIEVLTCCAYSLAYLTSNVLNMERLKLAVDAMPKLVLWVREANSSLCTPALIALGSLCTGFGTLDYSNQVVEAGGVPAMLSFLRKATNSVMQKEALFALSNVAGANSVTVQSMLDAGAFDDVLDLLRSTKDDKVRVECLYVLTNPWATAVGCNAHVTKSLVKHNILQELSNLLDPLNCPPILLMVITGLQDALKKGQQLMMWAHKTALADGTADNGAPPPSNPIAALLRELGTVDKLKALNENADEEVSIKANGVLNVLNFM